LGFESLLRRALMVEGERTKVPRAASCGSFEGGLALWLIDACAALADKTISFAQSQLGREGR
jgi:hypothetical protein